jgi:hypothetical protein
MTLSESMIVFRRCLRAYQNKKVNISSQDNSRNRQNGDICERGSLDNTLDGLVCVEVDSGGG